jgi:hypothetical protein
MEQHDTNCSAWEWTNGARILNNGKPCTCGFRTEEAQRRAKALANYRPLKPLRMSDNDFLRTLGIKPGNL